VIYLACPYSHPDPAVRDQRYLAACRATVSLLLAGKTVFSPIVHGHPLVQLGLSSAWQFWSRHDQWHLSRCDQVLVLPVDGWKESQGVQAEIELAQRLEIPVSYAQERDVCARVATGRPRRPTRPKRPRTPQRPT